MRGEGRTIPIHDRTGCTDYFRAPFFMVSNAIFDLEIMATAYGKKRAKESSGYASAKLERARSWSIFT